MHPGLKEHFAGQVIGYMDCLEMSDEYPDTQRAFCIQQKSMEVHCDLAWHRLSIIANSRMSRPVFSIVGSRTCLIAWGSGTEIFNGEIDLNINKLAVASLPIVVVKSTIRNVHSGQILSINSKDIGNRISQSSGSIGVLQKDNGCAAAVKDSYHIYVLILMPWCRETHITHKDWTHGVRTEVTSPTASCPARSFHVTHAEQKHSSSGCVAVTLDNW